jgi:hypothetical protein
VTDESNFYQDKDHSSIADFVVNDIQQQAWIVSYDNVPQIRELSKPARHVVYNIGYSARSASQGSEIMFLLRPHEGLAADWSDSHYRRRRWHLSPNGVTRDAADARTIDLLVFPRVLATGRPYYQGSATP